MPASLRILIVGGGIAGLALSRALQKQGIVPEIVERAASWPTGGTGLYLPGNGLRALQALGLAERLLAGAVRMPLQRILDHKGRRLAEIDLAQMWKRVGFCVGVPRSVLHRCLLEGSDGVPIRLATTVAALRQVNHEVIVDFTDGSTGTYDVIVGADGIYSSIRRLIFGTRSLRYVGQVSWRFLVDHSSAIGTWTAMLGPGKAFLAMPVGRNRLYVYADVLTSATVDPTGGDVARLRALFDDFAEPVPSILGTLENFDSIHFAPIEEVALDDWSQGRVVLIGDAAHATSPNMAQGASMALEDALVLAPLLAGHESPAAALSAFCQRRRARIGWVRQQTHHRDRIRNMPAGLRNLALRCAGTTLYRRDYRPLFEEP
jgi:2-polyprenyl-6-methoxyphenol hydroxylase-like FAD-dependent oxidoreductase